MFGRIRASSSSPESLERSSSKIFKDESFSIYESTIMKLKLGSQRDLRSDPMDATEEAETDDSSSLTCAESNKMEAYYTSASVSNGSHGDASSPNEDLMTVDTDSSPACSSQSSDDGQSSMDSSKLHRKNVESVLYLFSKFASCQQSSSYLEPITTEDGCSANTAPSSSGCQSEQECADSLVRVYGLKSVQDIGVYSIDYSDNC